jgi:hypothetical protein
LLSKSSTTNATLSINFTGLIDGDYYINATVNDTSGNNDSTSTRKIIINTTTSTCTPNWNYTSWSGCVNGFQMRNATDLNSCGVTTGRQSLNQSCTETCTPNWNCTDWDPSDEECEEGGTQRKTCNDLNNCNQSKPLESKICGNESGSGFWIITSLVIIFGILISAGIFFFMKNKFGSSLSPPTTVTGKFPPSGPSLKSYPRPRKIPRLPPRIPRLPIRPMMQRPVRMMGNQRNVGNTLQKKGNFRNKPL